MKLKALLLPVMSLFMVACGPKLNSDAFIKSTDAYALKINKNTDLKQTLTRGALTDASGFKDIGTFTYQEKFSQDEHALFQIKNSEKTDQTLTENYYFKADKLVLITSTSPSGNTKKLYIKNGKVISRVNIGKIQEKILINKAKLFKKQFKSAH
ncbi:hypothetical protein ES677_07160 [Bizionia gelidisalsuginis]|uniref:Lipoprotein n=1 Tax=Bizionia gelidisalsuginis TaxID=291188 RepID=A0ABY3MB71_9FLAO|nr:hypothetical protein [Bizionia gelidisalsuginis]TYC13504.1 hypothetical protein ES677_07160 [Bizionia gelidisalsuginis]